MVDLNAVSAPLAEHDVGYLPLDVDSVVVSLPTAITAGTTWNFQLIHRDVPQAGSTGVNLSDGLTITFAN